MLTKTHDRIDLFLREEGMFGRLRRPSLLLVVTGLAWAAQSVAVYYALGTDQTEVANAITIEFIIQFFKPFIIWILMTVVFYVLLKISGAKVRINRLFKLVGWGFVPFIFTGIIFSVGKYVGFQDVAVPGFVQVGVLASERDAYEVMVAQTAGDPIVVLTTVIGLGFVLISGYLWGIAVHNSTTLDQPKSWIISGIPTLAYVTYELSTVV